MEDFEGRIKAWDRIREELPEVFAAMLRREHSTFQCQAALDGFLERCTREIFKVTDEQRDEFIAQMNTGQTYDWLLQFLCPYEGKDGKTIYPLSPHTYPEGDEDHPKCTVCGFVSPWKVMRFTSHIEVTEK